MIKDKNIKFIIKYGNNDILKNIYNKSIFIGTICSISIILSLYKIKVVSSENNTILICINNVVMSFIYNRKNKEANTDP